MKRPANGGISHNISELPDILNNHFAAVGTKLASKISTSNTHFSEYLPNQTNYNSFAFEPVSQAEIELEILSLPLNKAHGFYACPTRLLKYASTIISQPFCKIINK